ncbi:unnamed protein product [Lepidochelys olivacea]
MSLPAAVNWLATHLYKSVLPAHYQMSASVHSCLSGRPQDSVLLLSYTGAAYTHTHTQFLCSHNLFIQRNVYVIVKYCSMYYLVINSDIFGLAKTLPLMSIKG